MIHSKTHYQKRGPPALGNFGDFGVFGGAYIDQQQQQEEQEDQSQNFNNQNNLMSNYSQMDFQSNMDVPKSGYYDDAASRMNAYFGVGAGVDEVTDYLNEMRMPKNYHNSVILPG